jgi:hypothetical protein
MDRMRGVVWFGGVLLLAACTRENGAFDDGASGGSAASNGGGTTNSDGGLDAPPPGSASGSGVDGNTIDDGPTTDKPGSTSEMTTMPPEGTTIGATEDGPPTTSEPQSCCEESLAPGCTSDIEGLEGEVCAERPSCCSTAWDHQCVELVALLGFDGCGIATDQCCELAPGCGLQYVEECVCGMQPSCCFAGWDFQCIQTANAACNTECKLPSNCCYQHEDPGCDDESVEMCVCGKLNACCKGPWNEPCVIQAMTCGGNICVG